MWRVALASSIGTSHQANGINCQDASGSLVIRRADEEILVAAVSDGAGSAKFSEFGSSLAISTTLDQIAKHFSAVETSIAGLTRTVALAWLAAIREAITQEAETSGHAINDYACTILIAIVGVSSAAFVQIGDGAIVVSHGGEDGFAYVFWPQHGEFANSTNFVTSADAEVALEFEIAPRSIIEVAVFSDGLENLVLHHATKTVHEPFFKKVFGPLRATNSEWDSEKVSADLSKLLMSPLICGKTDDDKSLVLATRIRD